MLALETAFEEILHENECILKQLDETVIAELLERLMISPHIFVTGKGRSGLIARCFAMRLMHLGTNSHGRKVSHYLSSLASPSEGT
jgi:6-phospho-3-hexuloisomerase